jgi:hypothetical protein
MKNDSDNACAETFEWILTALEGGGTLSVRAPFPGKSIFNARMTWTNEDPITGNISTSIFDALRNLEGTLKHHAKSQIQHHEQ